MTLVKLIVDAKDPSWVNGNTTILDQDEIVYLTNGSHALGDGVTQVKNLTFYGGGAVAQQTGLTSGGTITIGTYGGSGSNNDIRVAASTWFIIGNGTYSTSSDTDFLDISLASSGNQRYIGLYGNTSGVIVKVEGSEAALATAPSQPADTALIGYVLVGDAVVSSTPDLSGYLLKSDKALASDVTIGTNDTKYVTPLAMRSAALFSDISSYRPSGKRYYRPFIGQLSGSSGWSELRVAVPILVGEPHFVSALSCFAIAGASGITCRMALYSANSVSYPDQRLAEDSGNISLASLGTKTYTFNNPVDLTGKRLIYMCFVASGTCTMMNVINKQLNWLERPTAMTSATAPSEYLLSGGYQAWPDTFPAGATLREGLSLHLELTKV
jgi:hypothetical protein